MSETIALIRLSISSSRSLLAGVAIFVVATLLVIALIGTLFGDSGDTTSVKIALVWVCFPAGVAGMGLFHFGNHDDMRRAESGCNEWLLRMPVGAWKIALVPILLKTLWGVLFGTICIAIYNDVIASRDQDALPYLSPIAAWAAAAIWLMMLMWRPFRTGRRRVVALVVSAFLLYAICIAALVMGGEFQRGRVSEFAMLLSRWGPVALYAIAVALTIQTVRMARSNVAGLIPERTPRWDTASRDRVANHANPIQGLLWHDWLFSRSWIVRVYWLGVFPAAVLVAVMPLDWIVVSAVLFGGLAFMSVSRIGLDADPNIGMPVHMATKPISTATIAWTRLLFCVALSGITFCGLLLALGLSAGSAENRELWIDVWQSWAATSDSSSTAMTGLRWTAAAYLAALVFVVGQINGALGCGMLGRPSVSVAVSVACGATVVAAIIGFAIWIQQFANWDEMQSRLIEMIRWLPIVGVALLIGKAMSTALAARHVISAGHATRSAVAKVIGIWFALVLATGILWCLLIPDPRFTIWACTAVAIIAIPLSRIIILPACLAANRHR